MALSAIFWVFGTTRPGIWSQVSRVISEHSNHYTNVRFTYIRQKRCRIWFLLFTKIRWVKIYLLILWVVPYVLRRWLNDIKYASRSFWTINRTRTDIITPVYCGPGNNRNEGSTIELPWPENPTNTCELHTEPLDSCFNLIKSHQLCIVWFPRLEIEPATTECIAETLPWALSPHRTQAVPY